MKHFPAKLNVAVTILAVQSNAVTILAVQSNAVTILAVESSGGYALFMIFY